MNDFERELAEKRQIWAEATKALEDANAAVEAARRHERQTAIELLEWSNKVAAERGYCESAP